MDKEAIEEAIEVLEDASAEMLTETGDENYYGEAITILRQALETEQEPFEYWNAVEGWVKIDEVREHFDAVGCGTIYKSGGEGRSPLYTTPPSFFAAQQGAKMNDLRKAAEMALEALLNFPDDISDDMFESITALKAALAQPEQDTSAYHGWVLREVLFDNGEPVGHREPEQEPVAWTTSLDFDDDDQEIIPAKDKGKLGTSNCDIPLYTAPPKREWVGLTDDEVAQAMYRADAIITGPMQFRFAKEIEAKLKEKNHG